VPGIARVRGPRTGWLAASLGRRSARSAGYRSGGDDWCSDAR
jgi:hypothetical protein